MLEPLQTTVFAVKQARVLRVQHIFLTIVRKLSSLQTCREFFTIWPLDHLKTIIKHSPKKHLLWSQKYWKHHRYKRMAIQQKTEKLTTEIQTCKSIEICTSSTRIYIWPCYHCQPCLKTSLFLVIHSHNLQVPAPILQPVITLSALIELSAKCSLYIVTLSF